MADSAAHSSFSLYHFDFIIAPNKSSLDSFMAAAAAT